MAVVQKLLIRAAKLAERAIASVGGIIEKRMANVL